MNILRTFRDDRATVVGLSILFVAIVGALFAPVIAPIDPLAQVDVIQTRLLPPFTTDVHGTFHWLGTDRLGRDVFSRMVYGGRISLTVGLLAVMLSVVIGVAVGSTAAIGAGWMDRSLMAVTDAFLSLPRLVLLLAIVAITQPGYVVVVVVLGFTGWMSIARLVRGEVQRMLTEGFVAAAQATGVGRWRLWSRHLLPNSMTPVLVAATLAIGSTISLEAGLAFLGLGVPAPAPSWGNMIAGGREALVNAPWIATIPGLAIVTIVLACNLVGDGLQKALDPTRAQR